MTYSIDTHNDYFHEILVTLNGWHLTWTWYGSEVELEDILDFILDQSLTEYINFCFKPDDNYYDNHYYIDTLA